MKIGFPNNPRKDIVKEIEWIGKNKFDFIDLFLEEDKAIPEKIDVEKVKKVLKKVWLRSYWAYCLVFTYRISYKIFKRGSY